MKKIFILIAIFLFCFFPIKNVFALTLNTSTAIWSETTISIDSCHTASNEVPYYDSNELLGCGSCPYEEIFYPEKWITKYPTGYTGTLHFIEIADAGPGCVCADLSEEDCRLNYALDENLVIVSMPSSGPTADSEILGWGDSLTASAKDNVFAVITENAGTIALIFIGILAIFLLFRFIRKAVGGR
jgi:hypothetical protein